MLTLNKNQSKIVCSHIDKNYKILDKIGTVKYEYYFKSYGWRFILDCKFIFNKTLLN